jgi:hypothetical protein
MMCGSPLCDVLLPVNGGGLRRRAFLQAFADSPPTYRHSVTLPIVKAHQTIITG